MLGIGNESYKPSLKPRTLVCYICGREYGTLSLPIHLKTCEQRFLAEQAQKPKNQRKPLPKPPVAVGEKMTQDDIDRYNEGAFDTYNNDALEKCYNCGRTFKPESLLHHAKVCKPEKPFKPLPGYVPDRDQQKQQSRMPQPGGKTLSSPQPPQRPKTLLCYVCGREYGSKSLPIHIKQCKEMFLTQEAKKPRGQQRPLPSTPRGFNELLSRDDITFEDIEAYNHGAFNKYNTEALVPCQNCGRTFKPESLVHHQKACFTDKPFKPLNQQQQQQSQEQELQKCEKCGRNFASDRISKHQSVCKGQDPSKTTKQIDQTQLTPNQQANQTQVTQSQIQQKSPQTKSQLQQVPQQSKESTGKKIKCYVCLKEFLPVFLKPHVQDCTRKNDYTDSVPPLFSDLTKISDPSEFLIDLYHKSLIYSDQEIDSQSTVFQSPQKNNKVEPDILVNNQSEYLANQQNHQQQQQQAPQSVNQNYRKQFVPNVTNQNQQKEQESQQIKQTPQPSKQKSHTIEQEYKQPTQEYDDYEDESEQVDLVECSKCQRNFVQNRIKKHEKVCKGKQQKITKPQPVHTEPPKPTSWKTQHEEFMKIIEYNRKVKKIEESGGDIRTLGPPPQSNNDHLAQCKYCGRKFDPNRIEKHLSICQNVLNKPKGVPKEKEFLIHTPQKMSVNSMDKNIINKSGQEKRPASRHLQPTNLSVSQITSSAKLAPKQSVKQQQNIFQQSQVTQKQQNQQMRSPSGQKQNNNQRK